jgi:hypothetical protein
MRTAWPPADWPKMVTHSGSPPKCSMFSRTHWRAAIWSWQRRQVRSVGSIFTPPAAQIAAAVDPNHHRLPCLGVQRTGPNVQVQAIFTLTLGSCFEYRASSLRTYRAEVLSLPHSCPLSHGYRRPPTELTDRRLGIGHTQEFENPPSLRPSAWPCLVRTMGSTTDPPKGPQPESAGSRSSREMERALTSDRPPPSCLRPSLRMKV